MLRRHFTFLSAIVLALSLTGFFPRSTPTPPPAAAVVGFTQRTFFDDFDSLATIDVNNTKAPGFNWYVDSNWQATGWGTGWNLILNGIAIPSSSLSVSGSVLTITKPPLGSVYHMYSAAKSGVSSFVGHSFTNGFYSEARIKYTPANVSNATGWPAFWMNPAEFFTGTATKFSELDIMEAFDPTVSGRQWAQHYWDKAISNSSPVGADDHSASTLPTDSNFHTYAVLWIPIAKGSGTGTMKYYVDNVQQSSTITYTAGTDYAITDILNYFLIINCGAGTAASDVLVDYVAVWQTPP